MPPYVEVKVMQIFLKAGKSNYELKPDIDYKISVTKEKDYKQQIDLTFATQVLKENIHRETNAQTIGDLYLLYKAYTWDAPEEYDASRIQPGTFVGHRKYQ